jgi:hypothetical protein
MEKRVREREREREREGRVTERERCERQLGFGEIKESS